MKKTIIFFKQITIFEIIIEHHLVLSHMMTTYLLYMDNYQLEETITLSYLLFYEFPHSCELRRLFILEIKLIIT